MEQTLSLGLQRIIDMYTCVHTDLPWFKLHACHLLAYSDWVFPQTSILTGALIELCFFFAGAHSVGVPTSLQSQRITANDGWLCLGPLVLRREDVSNA